MLPKRSFLFVNIVLVALLTVAFTSNVQASSPYPDSILVPVTLYDFHSNGSNPEFEINPGSDARHLNMVSHALGADRKPEKGTTPYYSQDVAKWFRPYVLGAPGNLSIYQYQANGTNSVGVPVQVTYDTAFINMVFLDTLVFRLINGSQGSYRYDNANFFPLDGRGFGNELAQGSVRTHNYSFTMELHWQFKKVKGMTFTFTGDDDVWAFIADSLRMDIGGIHNPITGSVDLDTISGLENGKTYWLDFFSAERHVTSSRVQITTNIIYTVPQKISVTYSPKVDTLPAGDSIVFTGQIFDDTGAVRPDYSKLIQWKLLPPNTSSSMTAATGASSTFKGVKAYVHYQIIADFQDPNDPTKMFHDTLPVYVKPGKPTKLVIEADTVITNLYATDPLANVNMDSITNQATVYAVTYDKFNNYVGKSVNPTWTSLDNTVVTVAPTPQKSYAGIIQRQTRNQKSTTVVVAENGLTPDSVIVIVQVQPTEMIDVCLVTGGKYDSLHVEFNGPVNWTTTAVTTQTLYIKHPQGAKEKFADILAKDVVGNFVKETKSAVFIFPAGIIASFSDSVTLQLPISPSNRAFMIDLCRQNSLIGEIKAGPNPFIPGVSVIPVSQQGGTGMAQGIRIEVVLRNPITGSLDAPGTIGTITIIDAVSNVIVDNKPLGVDPNSKRKKLFLIWDGKTSKGAAAGGGTYVARIVVEDKNLGLKDTRQIRVGIRIN